MSTFLIIMHIVWPRGSVWTFKSWIFTVAFQNKMPSMVVELECLILCWNYCCPIKWWWGKVQDLMLHNHTFSVVSRCCP